MRCGLVGLMVLLTGSAQAGWFGPSTYEECVLENMKGVSSNAAALAIADACRAKFPLPPSPPPPPPSEEEKAKFRADMERNKEEQEQWGRIRKKSLDELERSYDSLKPNPQSQPQPNLGKCAPVSGNWWDDPRYRAPCIP